MSHLGVQQIEPAIGDGCDSRIALLQRLPRQKLLKHLLRRNRATQHRRLLLTPFLHLREEVCTLINKIVHKPLPRTGRP